MSGGIYEYLNIPKYFNNNKYFITNILTDFSQYITGKSVKAKPEIKRKWNIESLFKTWFPSLYLYWTKDLFHP